MKLIHFFLFAAVILLLICLNGFAEKPIPDSPLAVKYQNQIDAFKKLHYYAKAPKDPSDLSELKRQVNASDYFKVFKNLSIEKGWELDYIYWADGLGSYPILYARKIGQKIDFKKKLIENKKLFFDYLNHIKTDGTKDGFFQYAALSLLGNQFALYWHALYNDTIIICTREVLKEVLAKKDKSFYDFDRKFIREAGKVNPEPKVSFDDDTAVVSILTFTSWGGLIEKKFYIKRKFPHKIIKKEQSVLAAFDCGIRF